jgi:hypothetical protein
MNGQAVNIANTNAAVRLMMTRASPQHRAGQADTKIPGAEPTCPGPETALEKTWTEIQAVGHRQQPYQQAGPAQQGKLFENFGPGRGGKSAHQNFSDGSHLATSKSRPHNGAGSAWVAHGAGNHCETGHIARREWQRQAVVK